VNAGKVTNGTHEPASTANAGGGQLDIGLSPEQMQVLSRFSFSLSKHPALSYV